MKLIVVLLALLAAGCSSGGSTVPRRSGSPHALSARILLPSRTMTAGSAMQARVVVTNNTGHAIHATGCGTLFQVALTSRGYHPDVAWLSCLQRLTIRAGVSTFRVPVLATYLNCSEVSHGHSAGTPGTCPSAGGMPPLPAGRYVARLFQSSHLVQPPPGVPVRVLAAAPAGG